MRQILLFKFLILLVAIQIFHASVALVHHRRKSRGISGKNRSNQRVQIEVYRGANNEREQYAPWGFFVRQPSDNNHY